MSSASFGKLLHTVFVVLLASATGRAGAQTIEQLANGAIVHSQTGIEMCIRDRFGSVPCIDSHLFSAWRPRSRIPVSYTHLRPLKKCCREPRALFSVSRSSRVTGI